MVAEQRKSVVDKPPQLLGGTAIKPPERHGWEAIRYFIYDKDTGKYFSRTPMSWLLIFIFYCIYYTCLAAFWYGMLNIFFITLPYDKPKYVLDGSIIGTNPGVGMRPRQPDVTIDSSMLHLKYNAENEKASEDFETASNIDWAKRYELFVKKFDNLTETRTCSGDEPETGQDACRFDVNTLGSCGQFPYGYQLEAGKEVVEPCVLLKINRIFEWIPEPFEDEDLDEQEEMPDHIKKQIRSNRNRLYLDCQGENPVDREILIGKVDYFPSNQGISFRYFPYNQAHKNYHNPVVAVKFKNLPVNTLLHIECKLWAKGIEHSRKDRRGQVHFEVYLEKEEPRKGGD